MTPQATATSPKIYARIGGMLYLVNIVVGFFAIGYVPGVIVVANNAAATSANILSHELLYRLGIVAHIIILLTNIPLAVIFFHLFRIVNKNVALLVVFFTLVGTAVEAVNLLNQFAPLLVLRDGLQQNVPTPEQSQSFVLGLLRLETVGFNLALIFFGSYGVCAGYLIFKSTFLPKFIGIFLAFGGICYLFYSFAIFLSPQFATHLVPYIQIPSGLAELTFCLWLLLAGVNLTKWKRRQIFQSEEVFA
jgi:Domain of unknown function (DUF4386)